MASSRGRCWRARGSIRAGELGLAFVGPEESRALKQEHLGVDEATDALAFPIDGLAALPDGMPRQLGDVVVCPDVAGTEWRRPLVHALLHLVGFSHRSRDEDRGGGVCRMTVTPLPRDPEDQEPDQGQRRSSSPAPGRAPSLLESFNYAVEGVIHVLRTQQNLRIQKTRPSSSSPARSRSASRGSS